MVDETLDRLYREGELNKAIESGFRALARHIMATFETLHRIEWEEPWTAPKRPKCN